ncbi:MAG: glycerol-3-phosphate 1-O-acyltransferase PlsY [Bacillota bacterium]
MNFILLIAIGYLIGSIPSGLIVGKMAAGVDIREHGSGNLGGTNAFRVLGVKLGLIVTIADILKGLIPTYLGIKWGGDAWAIAGGAAAIFGHSYPLFAGLRGGKGIATGAGVFLVLMPHIIGLSALVFAAVLFTTQYVSLSSLLGALTLVIGTIVFKMGALKIITALLVFGFVVYRHRANIERLLYGREAKAKLWKR